MRLRIDGIYRDRAGQKRGPLRYREHNRDMPWFINVGSGVWSWSHNGAYLHSGEEHERDLIAEWVEEKNQTPIDLCDLDHFRRGVAKVMGSLSR